MRLRGLLTLLSLCGSAALAVDGIDLLANGIGGDVHAPDGSGWSIEDGVLVPARGPDRGYLVTTRPFANTEITLGFFPEAGTNSGVFLRCQDPGTITPQDCYEFNIWDAHPRQEWRTGAIVTIASPVARVDTEDRWNTLRIRADGNRLQVWVNDTLTNDIEDDKLADGFIAFQYGGDNGLVKFRDIRVVELP